MGCVFMCVYVCEICKIINQKGPEYIKGIGDSLEQGILCGYFVWCLLPSSSAYLQEEKYFFVNVPNLGGFVSWAFSLHLNGRYLLSPFPCEIIKAPKFIHLSPCSKFYKHTWFCVWCPKFYIEKRLIKIRSKENHGWRIQFDQ